MSKTPAEITYDQWYKKDRMWFLLIFLISKLSPLFEYLLQLIGFANPILIIFIFNMFNFTLYLYFCYSLRASLIFATLLISLGYIIYQ